MPKQPPLTISEVFQQEQERRSTSMNEIPPRLPHIDPQPDTTELEAVIRSQQADIIQGIDPHDQIRADAINAVLRAKGVPDNLLLTAYEAGKVFTILSHTEELSGYSG